MRRIICWCLIWVVVFALLGACVQQGISPGGEDVRSQIAEAYGIQSFGRIQKLQYTFNQKDGAQTIRRFWIWEPAADRVTFKGGGQLSALTYTRRELAGAPSAAIKQIDQWFLHDNYWLMLPFRMAWDHQAEVADMGLCQTPLKGESARCVNVVYPATVAGNILGDTYKLFLDGDWRIIESIYQPADTARQQRVMRWTKNRPVGPIVLSLNRADSQGHARFWFTNLGVQLEGDKWLWAD